MSDWVIARRRLACSTLDCKVVIEAGEPVYLVTAGRWPVCVPCSARRFLQRPPETLAEERPGVAVAPASSFARFDPVSVAARTRQAILEHRRDVKTRQSGGD